MTSFVDETTARIREQVGDGRVVCGLSGGVDSTVAALLIHRAIGDRLTCIFVDNGVMRLDEAGADRAALRAAASCRSSSSTPRRCSSIGSPASPIRSRSARSSARRSSTCSRREATKLGLVRLPRAGHALSRRHRERLGHRAVARDQEPPQRRRPARAHALQAGRAAAAAVQGRSARGRQGARPRRRVRLAAAVSGSGPGGAHPRRGHRVAARPGPPRRRDRRGGSEGAPAGTASCGSRSPCCCRSRASA